MASVQEKFPQLKPDNFNNWIFRVQCILDEKQLLHTINMDQSKIKHEDEEFMKANAKAKSIIVQCIPDKYLNIIKSCKTANDMIDILKNIFERKSIISIIHLRRKLLNLKQKVNEKSEDYFEKFETIVRELECNQEKLSDRDKIACLLTGLDTKYDTVITAIECNSDMSGIAPDLKLDFVKQRLLDEELKISEKNSNTANIESAFYTCHICNKQGHIAKYCRSNRGHHRGYRGHCGTQSQKHLGHDNPSETDVVIYGIKGSVI